MKLFVIIAIFLLVGGYFVVQINNLDLTNANDRESFLGKFWMWVKGVGKTSVDVVGYAADKDWLPTENINNTNSTVKNK